jgi:hypothetical protein
MITWTVAKKLARCPRPGYGGERGASVPREEVDQWLAEARREGVRSIICLLDPDHLGLYADLGVTLGDYYRAAGFDVVHLPTPDHQSPPVPQATLDLAWDSFQRLTKPVLVHCSAGIDRSGAVTAFVFSRCKDETAPGL